MHPLAREGAEPAVLSLHTVHQLGRLMVHYLLLFVSTNSFPSIGFDRFSIESLSATDAMISAGGQFRANAFSAITHLYGSRL